MKFSYEDSARKVEYEVCNSEDLSWHTLMDHYANFLRSLGYVIEDNMEYLESYSRAYDVEGEKAALKQEADENALDVARDEVKSYCVENYVGDLEEVLARLGEKGLEIICDMIRDYNDPELWDELAKAEMKRYL